MNQLCVFALIKELKEKAKKTERTNRVRITVFPVVYELLK